MSPLKTFQNKYQLISNVYVCDVKRPLSSSRGSSSCRLSWQSLKLSSSCFCMWSLCLHAAYRMWVSQTACSNTAWRLWRHWLHWGWYCISVLEILSLSVRALTACNAKFCFFFFLPVLQVKEGSRREKKRSVKKVLLLVCANHKFQPWTLMLMPHQHVYPTISVR